MAVPRGAWDTETLEVAQEAAASPWEEAPRSTRRWLVSAQQARVLEVSG